MRSASHPRTPNPCPLPWRRIWYLSSEVVTDPMARPASAADSIRQAAPGLWQPASANRRQVRGMHVWPGSAGRLGDAPGDMLALWCAYRGRGSRVLVTCGQVTGARGRVLTWPSSAPQPDVAAVRVGEDREPAVVPGQVSGAGPAACRPASRPGPGRRPGHRPACGSLTSFSPGSSPGRCSRWRLRRHRYGPGRTRPWPGRRPPASRTLAVELLRPLVVRTEDLEERHRLAHVPSPFRRSVSEH